MKSKKVLRIENDLEGDLIEFIKIIADKHGFESIDEAVVASTLCLLIGINNNMGEETLFKVFKNAVVVLAEKNKFEKQRGEQ